MIEFIHFLTCLFKWAEIFHPFYRNCITISEVYNIIIWLLNNWSEFDSSFLNAVGPELVSRVRIADEINRIYDEYNISQYGIDKSYFIIEITEQGLATATDSFYEQLAKIRENGYKLWVDDFGSGYSSLNVFSNFDIDLIKFDMNLLMNLDNHGGANRVIIKALIDVAHQLGIHTLCEGMETDE